MVRFMSRTNNPTDKLTLPSVLEDKITPALESVYEVNFSQNFERLEAQISKLTFVDSVRRVNDEQRKVSTEQH